MEWYIKKGIPLDIEHFLFRANDTGDWSAESISSDQIIKLIEANIQNIDFKSIREDVVRFIPDDKIIAIWSPNYFLELLDKLKFKVD